MQYMSLNKQYATANAAEAMKSRQLTKNNRVLQDRVAQLEAFNKSLNRQLEVARIENQSAAPLITAAAETLPQPLTTDSQVQTDVQSPKDDLLQQQYEQLTTERDALQAELQAQHATALRVEQLQLQAMTRALAYSSTLEEEKLSLQQVVTAVEIMLTEYEQAVTATATRTSSDTDQQPSDTATHSLPRRVAMLLSDIHHLLVANVNLQTAVEQQERRAAGHFDIQQQLITMQYDLLHERSEKDALLTSNTQLKSAFDELYDEVQMLYAHIEELQSELANAAAVASEVATASIAATEEDVTHQTLRQQLLQQLEAQIEQSRLAIDVDETPDAADESVARQQPPGDYVYCTPKPSALSAGRGRLITPGGAMTDSPNNLSDIEVDTLLSD